MDALDLLLNRRSLPRLEAPAPAGEVLENILRAGLRAPDHAGLTPWRFIIAEGAGLDKLGIVLENAAKADGAEEAVVTKAKNAPHRAPMVITVVANVTAHDKVPVLEQHLSAGCAVQAMQMAAVAQGFSGFWRTGKWAYHAAVREALNVTGDDEIVGFLYLGTPGCNAAKVHERDLGKFVEYL